MTVSPTAEAARIAFAEPVACCLKAVDAAEVGAGTRWRCWGAGARLLLLGLLARAAGRRA